MSEVFVLPDAGALIDTIMDHWKAKNVEAMAARDSDTPDNTLCPVWIRFDDRAEGVARFVVEFGESVTSDVSARNLVADHNEGDLDLARYPYADEAEQWVYDNLVAPLLTAARQWVEARGDTVYEELLDDKTAAPTVTHPCPKCGKPTEPSHFNPTGYRWCYRCVDDFPVGSDT